MVPISPSVPGSTLTPTTGPLSNPTPPQDTTPPHNLLEVQLGANFIPGTSPQGQLGFVLQPGNLARLGLRFSSNFSDMHQLTAQGGVSLRPSDVFTVSLMGEAGLGILSDNSVQAGLFQQQVTRNGIRYLLGGTIEVDANLHQRVGLYFTLSALGAINSSLTVTPGSLRDGQEGNPNEFIFIGGAGIRFGGVDSRPTSSSEPEAQTPPRITAHEGPSAEQVAAQREAALRSEMDQRISALRTELTNAAAATDRERIETAITNTQVIVSNLRRDVTLLSRGINLTNEMTNVVENVRGSLTEANTNLTPENRQRLEAQLLTLGNALQNQGGDADLNESILRGLRHIPSSDARRAQMISGLTSRLIDLQASLRARSEGPLADRVAALQSRLEGYGREHPQPILLSQLQENLAALDAQIGAVRTIIGEARLTRNTHWQRIQTEFGNAREELQGMIRTTAAFNQFIEFFMNQGTFFVRSIGTPAAARGTFERANNFLTRLPAGVNLERLKTQFSLLFDTLKFNLAHFIEVNNTPANRPRNLAALQAAQALARTIDPSCAAATADLGSATPVQRSTRPVRPGNTAAAAATAISAAQLAAHNSSIAARADSTTASRLFDSVASANTQRSALQSLATEIANAATAAETADRAAHTSGVTLATAQQQATEAQRQAGIAHTKLAELRRGVAAANRLAPTPTLATVPVVNPNPTPPVVRDAGTPQAARPAADAGNNNRAGMRPGAVDASELR